MTEFKWYVERMNVSKNYDNQQDVVFEVWWACSGEEIVDGKSYDSTWYSQTRFTPKVDQNFTPFDQLTENQVLNWIWSSGVNQIEIENNVQKGIDAKKSPPTYITTGPWNNNNNN